MERLLKLKGWALFGWLALLTTAPLLIALPFVDFGSLDDALFLTALANRGALPWLVASFAASSAVRLRPNRFTRWLMQNRRYFGLAFALGMGWQIVMIARLALGFPDFYNATFPLSPGMLIPWAVFGILGLMALTSFRPFAKAIGGKVWRVLHKGGMYIFWLIFTGAYGAKAFAAPALDLPHALAFLAFAALVFAWILRIEAWMQHRAKRGAGQAAAA